MSFLPFCFRKKYQQTKLSHLNAGWQWMEDDGQGRRGTEDDEMEDVGEEAVEEEDDGA